jgi:hypothetical protein
LLDSLWGKLKDDVPKGLRVDTEDGRRCKFEYIRAAQWRIIIGSEDPWRAFCDAAVRWQRLHAEDRAQLLPRLSRFAKPIANRELPDGGSPEVPCEDTSDDKELNEIVAQTNMDDIEKLEQACRSRRSSLATLPAVKQETVGETISMPSDGGEPADPISVCTQKCHVCGPSVEGGCTSCGKRCHFSNVDVRCSFHGRDAGDLPWKASAADLLDTVAGTGGLLPHRTQVEWSVLGVDRHSSTILRAFERDFFVGKASGEGCNCLIHALSQCLGIITNIDNVRQDLIKQFSSSDGRMKVARKTFLELEYHWLEVLRGIFRHADGHEIPDNLGNIFCVVGLYLDSPGHGLVVGNVAVSARRLVIGCQGFVHFVPCLPFHGALSQNCA